ncbi:MAG: DUF1996 domain-containing protein, partial [Pseudonocardiaceae bacterium]
MTRGKHRIATPVRLLAAAAAVLAVGGIMVATGTASADNALPASRAADLGDQVACRVGQVMVLSDLVKTLRGDQRAEPSTAFAAGHGGAGSSHGGRAAPAVEPAGRVNCVSNNDDENDDNNNDGNNDNDGNGNGDNDGDNGENNDGNGDEEEFPGRDEAGGPADDDFIDIEQVSRNVEEPERKDNASTGTFTSDCGTNEEGHRNSDNFMVAPGKVNGAQHVHDYVGNLSTDAFSDDESLDDADTTCARGDKSTYFWPVLRDTSGEGADANDDGGGLDGNVGEILDPAAVDLEFRGSPDEAVTAMPEGLSVIMGDAKAVTNGDADAKAAWTCTGFEDRTTTKYPLCPRGSQLMRVLDFPSCWDGENLDSANHRDHIVFPDRDGSCDDGTVAVPQLRMTLTYDRPDGKDFAMDSFPEQRHNPNTDHADFMNMMPDDLMAKVVDCIN